MEKHGVRSSVLMLVSVALLVFAFGVFVAGGAENSSLERFLATPSLASWDAFESDVKSGKYGPKGSPFQELLVYDDARVKRDLPNSMALKGITPGEFVKLQSGRADSALACIRKKESKDLWRVLSKLATQDFDEDLMWTALEISARVSPAKFEMMAADVEKCRPDESWIVKRIREKWLPSK